MQINIRDVHVDALHFVTSWCIDAIHPLIKQCGLHISCSRCCCCDSSAVLQLRFHQENIQTFYWFQRNTRLLVTPDFAFDLFVLAFWFFWCLNCKKNISSVLNFYARKQLLLSAHLSHRNSVCLSVRLSHGWISQKRCKIRSPNLHHRLHGRLVSGTVKLFHKLEGGHLERGR